MSKIRLSCLPVSIYPMFASGEMTISEWAEAAGNIGFEYFDLGEASIAKLSVEGLKSIRRECVIPFHMLSAYSDFTNSDETVRKQEVEKACEKIRKIAALGGHYIRLPGGPAHMYAVDNEAETIEKMAECFDKCIPVAEENGVRIVFENDSKPPLWETANFCFDIGRFTRTWNKLKDLDIGFNFDTGNAFFLGEWEKILNPVLGRIETIHITDYMADIKTGKVDMAVFGQGNVPIEKMLNIIVESGFPGKIITMEDTTFQGLDGTKKSFEYTRQIVDKLFG